MNRFLILLLMVGWALYIVQVNSGQTGDAVRSEKNPAACPLGSDERSAARFCGRCWRRGWTRWSVYRITSSPLLWRRRLVLASSPLSSWCLGLWQASAVSPLGLA